MAKISKNNFPAEISGKDLGFDYVADVSIGAIEGGSQGTPAALDLGQPKQIINRTADNVSASRNYDAIVDINGKGDFTDIQKALDAGKKRLFIRNGTYEISSTIYIVTSGISISGEDKFSTIIKQKTSTPLDSLIVVGRSSVGQYIQVTNFLISNITIDLNSNASSLQGALSLIYCDDVIIQNCIFSNIDATKTNRYLTISYNGSYLSNRIYILSCIFDDCDYGIFINSIGSGFWVINNYFYGGGASIFSSGGNCFIVNNFMNGVEEAIAVGAQSSASANGDLTIVDGNIIINATFKGILVSGQGSFYGSDVNQNTIVANNIIKDCARSAIELESVQFCSIVNNKIINCGKELDNTYIGIYITGNDDASPTSYSTYNIIKGNSIQSSEANKLKYGIYETFLGCDYNIITENIVLNTSSTPIYIKGANTIKANNIE